MSLCRLLLGGFEAKRAVDSAIGAMASQVGDLLLDIHSCKAQAEAPAPALSASTASHPAGSRGGGAPPHAVVAAPLDPQFVVHADRPTCVFRAQP
ncbi:hypothetical protein GPECTOR_176g222 [Gonium pectorale]|uniref:Uncharacterized protein n=1 Tax=Gonium pectorale TaxID=33097 RepID=A0A150FX99_GONPE|nr:hypothetical protein GPECTOR_176g222 [Gonium pectorale]|eukprot:KXZ42241.1 hypothetical protein GPECTOR_176g222 [Gonium pectorale]